MRRILYYSGQVLQSKHGNLTYVSDAAPKIQPSGKICRRIKVKCGCGNIFIVARQSIASGLTSSCGCINKQMCGDRARTHGKSGSAEYNSWASIHQRCYYQNSTEYYLYGARGIKVCDRWKKFENFYKDMGEKPSPRHSIDRINNDGNYEPSNCRWATYHQQQSNRRNNNATVGVYYDKWSRSWRAMLKAQGKNWSKRFKTEQEAILARRQAEKDFGV